MKTGDLVKPRIYKNLNDQFFWLRIDPDHGSKWIADFRGGQIGTVIDVIGDGIKWDTWVKLLCSTGSGWIQKRFLKAVR